MRARKLWDDLQTSLWFRPTLWVIGLGALALILIAVDQWLVVRGVEPESAGLPLLFAGGADGARTMLGSISATALTVATLAYSVIMVAVVQTANAFSPRILRQYLADTSQQHVLGVLIGVFLYSLLVLRVVRSTDEATFVPAVSVTVGIVLALISIGAFIYFLNHVAHSIEVRHIVRLIQKEGEDLLDEVFPETLGRAWSGGQPPILPAGQPAIVSAAESGYIQFITPDELLTALTQAGAVARLEHVTGEHVLQGMPLAVVWPAEALTDDLTGAIRQAYQLGRERTTIQDLLFVVRQLTDIALRAISPAVNDPTTAVNCIDTLGALLVKMAQHPPVSPYRCDADGRLRVIAYGPTFETMLDWSFTQIRQYAATDFACTIRLIEVCGEIGYSATETSQRAALWRHIRMVARSADRHLQEPDDRAAVNARLVAAAEVLGQGASTTLS